MRTRSTTAVAVVLALTLAAACGSRLPADTVVAGSPVQGGASPERGAGPSVDAEGPSDAGVTDTEIRVGATMPISGLLGSFVGDEFTAAVDSYFKLVNSQGGVNGRKLRLITYDNRLDIAQDASNIRRLLEQDGVIASFGMVGDSIAEYVTQKELPALVFGFTAPPFSSRYPTLYPLTGNLLLWSHQFIRAIKESGRFRPGMRVAIAYSTQILSVQPYIDLIKEGWELAGAKVVSVDSFELTGGDCSPLIQKMKQLDVDWWDLQTLGYIFCISGAQRVGYRPNVGWGTWGSSIAGLIKQAGPWSEGMWGAMNGDKVDTGAPRSDRPSEAIEEYRSTVVKYHPEMDDKGHLESPVLIAFWSGAKLLVDAIRAQGRTVTRAGLNRWLQKVEDYPTDLGMPIGSLRPDCKVGSEYIWIGEWSWNDGKPELMPKGNYLTSEYKDRYGGECFLTKIADELVR